MIYGILALIVIIAPILTAYYYDYKSDKKEFTFSIKSIGTGLLKGVIIYAIFIGIIKIFPLNKNHGIDYNDERQKLGIPKIENNWEIHENESDQFTTYWWSPKPYKGHFKKKIEYGLFSSKYEFDYYTSKHIKKTVVWSKYNFEKNTFEYFLEKPNDQVTSINDKGYLKLEKQTKIEKINKTEFENYLTE